MPGALPGSGAGPVDPLALLTAYQHSAVLSSAVMSGVADALAEGDGGHTVEEVAKAAGTDPRATRILCSALVAIGLAERADGLNAGAPVDAGTAFSLSEAGAVLASDHPQTLAWIVRKEWFFYGVWNELPQAMEDGRGRISPWRDRIANDRGTAFGFLRALDDLASRFGGELAEAAAAAIPAAADGGTVRLLDVGGASGSHSARLAGLRADVKPTVLDLPEIAPILGERHPEVPFTAGDFAQPRFGRPEGEEWDVVLLANILHDHTPEQNERLVREAAGLLAPGGTLVLYEWIPNPDTTAPDLSLFAVMMMVENDGGDAYSEAEHRRWLEAAGFDDIALARGFGPIAVLSARKPA
jgi:SAM-dependent methyltransferase